MEKIQGCERLGNELVFDYTNFSTETIKAYLDLLHGISLPLNTELLLILNLLRFLRSEGKACLDGNEVPISSNDHRLYNAIHTVLDEAPFNCEEMFLAGLLLSDIDSYDGRFFKVSCFQNNYYSRKFNLVI